jgi:hypothetical protein
VTIRYAERLGKVGINSSVGTTRVTPTTALAKTINGLYKAGFATGVQAGTDVKRVLHAELA